MFFKGFLKSKRVYLDYAASTPPGAVLQKKLQLPRAALIANPSGLHQEAVLAKRYREAARARVAEVLGAQKNEIIFTSGATESNNLALQGTVRSWIAQGVAPEKIFLMVSELEHSAVRRVAEELKNMYNIGVVCLPAINGVVSPKEIQIPEGAAAILISVLFTQNEFGTIQPIKEIAKRIRFFRKQYPEVQIVFHSDATQAPRYYELRVQTLGVDLLTIGATKLPMQKGVGILFKSSKVRILPLFWGGQQEGKLRAGTESLQLLHEFSLTLAAAQKNKEKNFNTVLRLRNYFEKKLKEKIPEMRITAKEEDRSPHISHVSISEFDSELLVLELDARGVALSSQSACVEEVPSDAYMRKLFDPQTGVLRFSFAPETTQKDLDFSIAALQSVLKKYR